MALLDKAYKQRMVGALVLVALAVIFLPGRAASSDGRGTCRAAGACCAASAA
jgi:cell division septation protein DedD